MSSIVILGMFDGVHIGHARLFSAAEEIQRRTRQCIYVYTFKNHPLELITGKKMPLLMTEGERKEKMLSFGANEVFFDEFNEKVRDTDCADFVKSLKTRFCADYVIAGFNYSFGKDGAGDAELLKKLGAENAISVEIVNPVTYCGEIVSSSRIRQAICDGDMERASTLLMQNFRMSGIVERCRQVGRQMGYPTANIRNSEGKVLPRMGVYATLTHIGSRSFFSITNVGTNPTFGELATSVETHILDFDEDIYDEYITVEFLHFVRDQRRFGCMDELKMQITTDTEKVRTYFAENNKQSL